MNVFHGSKKHFFIILAVFTAIVCAFVGIVWWCGRAYARVTLPQKYWLLVRDCEDSTAAAIIGNTYLSGGAGYLIETGGKQSVVIACYYSEVSAESVRRSMEGKGIETHIVKRAPSDFTLSGNSSSYKERIIENAETADTCAKILYDTANNLERTAISQEEARAAVRGVVSSLHGLQEGNTDRCFSQWNTALLLAERKGIEIANGIIFAKDLRYLQVQLCISISNTGDYF
ncbi:MAG: hypothetical protein K2G44_01220 [Clostridia bacterium]|nr:hypothetical protein [Clostridia bacterium]MDE6676993.1 hypothetical protein [Clostridia bacterium]